MCFQAAVPMFLIETSPVPEDCTMRGLQFMPLYLDRLMSSRTWARITARTDLNLGAYALNLWAAAWRGSPAGSIEDDEDVLRAAAQCPTDLWSRVRGEVLRGWHRCKATGRVYHRVVCEVAADVWEDRVAKRAGLAKARDAKARKRARAMPVNQGELPLPATVAREAQDHVVDATTMVDPGPQSFQGEPENPDNRLESLNSVAEPVSVTDVKREVTSERKGEETPLTPRATTRGTRLPLQWEPDADSALFASRLGLTCDAEAEAFGDRSRGTGRRSPDWQAAFRDWCRGAAARRAPRHPIQKPGKMDEYRDVTLARLIDQVGPEQAHAMDEWAYGRRAA